MEIVSTYSESELSDDYVTLCSLFSAVSAAKLGDGNCALRAGYGMSGCPCGSGVSLAECCQPIIDGDLKAERAEALIRARYTAHTLGAMDFILATHHPSTRNEIDEAATKRWAQESTWLGFEIIKSDDQDENSSTARIEFMARYRDAARRRHTHHERAVFEKYHGQWYFRDAEVPEVDQFKRVAPKQGRNDPCACGSGKKYKKCCAAADLS